MGKSEPIKTYKKIDENTVEETITIPEKVTKTNLDKAELQTELDHIPDKLVECQDSMDCINCRKTELKEILKVFE